MFRCGSSRGRAALWVLCFVCVGAFIFWEYLILSLRTKKESSLDRLIHVVWIAIASGRQRQKKTWLMKRFWNSWRLEFSQQRFQCHVIQIIVSILNPRFYPFEIIMLSISLRLLFLEDSNPKNYFQEKFATAKSGPKAGDTLKSLKPAKKVKQPQIVKDEKILQALGSSCRCCFCIISVWISVSYFFAAILQGSVKLSHKQWRKGLLKVRFSCSYAS